MASILTDESRQARYAVLRKRKKILERIFDIMMWGTLLELFIEIVSQFVSGVLQGIFMGELIPFFVFLFVLAAGVFSVYALFRRDLRFLLPAVILTGLMNGMGCFVAFGVLLPVFLSIAGINSIFWAKLKQEEGFPLFDISFIEEQERQKVQEKRTEYRTLQAQIRAAQETLDTDAEMTDLLDADTKKDYMPAHLNNYHERYRNADAVVQIPEAHDDKMDLVEEPEPSGEMDEL